MTHLFENVTTFLCAISLVISSYLRSMSPRWEDVHGAVIIVSVLVLIFNIHLLTREDDRHAH